LTFDFYSCRFTFSARDSICFPVGLPGNILRGALGSVLRKIACVPECPGHSGRDVRECERRMDCAYARIFEPAALAGGPGGTGPSGLSDWPRPFVLRAAHLDHQTVAAGQNFWFDINLFEMRYPILDYFERTLQQLAAEGFGPGRGRADLLSVERHEPISVSLQAPQAETGNIRVVFRTPTELKRNEELVTQPDFGTLFARARDRVSTLRSLYGAGPLEIDFHAVGERASAVRTTQCQVRHLAKHRRSSRTGQSHGIGGFVGWAEYQGELSEFLPILQAAQWTGVGRHCVWGNGELRVEILDHL
jgi:CRISPR-associated endoribonuclease Cas6